MNHSNDSSNTPMRTDESVRTGVVPSEALTRFEPPHGFVSEPFEAGNDRLRYGFRVANYSLLIRNDVGSEVVPLIPIATVPTGPSWLSGIINLRGNLVPVCDLGKLLDVKPDGKKLKSMILVLGKGEDAAGFIVDGHPHALAGLSPLNQVPVLPDILLRYVDSAHAFEDEIWLEFDHERFLLGAE